MAKTEKERLSIKDVLQCASRLRLVAEMLEDLASAMQQQDESKVRVGHWAGHMRGLRSSAKMVIDGFNEFERLAKRGVYAAIQRADADPTRILDLLIEIEDELTVKAEPQVTATDEKSPARADDYGTKGTKKPTRKKAKNH